MKHFLPSCLVVVLLSVASQAQSIISFDVPGAVNTQPMAISPSGQITGSYEIPNTTRVRGFIRDRSGQIITFDVAGMNTLPASINARGQITGIYTANAAAVAPFHSFLREPDGEIITFDAPDAWDSEAISINARGEIVGWMQSNWTATNPNSFHGFLRHPDGTFTTFDVADSYAILPSAIEANGQVIGYWTDPSATRGRGFLRRPDGTTIDIDAPASLKTNTWPYGINPKGQIVGAYTLHCPFPAGTCTTDPHSFLREPDGRYLNVDVPSMTFTVALGIDARGQIAGYTYQGAAQQMHGFLRGIDGSVRVFDAPNSSWTIPVAMNLAGEITGEYFDSSNAGHGFIFSQRTN